MASEDIIIELDGWSLSAKRREPATPARATILALPGGGYTSAYWDHPLCQEGSLLQLGASLGYRVIALDRPGYGASVRQGEGGVLLDDQASILSALVDQLAGDRGAGAGIFLVGHSLGGILSMMIGALATTRALLGLDLSGVPFRYSDILASAVANAIGGAEEAPGTAPAELFYGPPGSFNPAVARSGNISSASTPVRELDDSRGWPDRFVEIAENVRVPVQYTLGEFETVTASSWEALHEIGAQFKSAPDLLLHRQNRAGHNISLHYIGRAFHLRAIAFADEIVAARTGAA